MSNLEFEILIKKNKEYNDAFNNNPWFNKTIMSLIVCKEEVTIEDALDIIYKLSVILMK